MNASPFDGHSRAFLRFILAGVLAFDLLAALAYVWSGRNSGVVHPLAPALLLGIGKYAVATALLGVAGAAGVVLFALRPARVWPGLLALFAIGLLVETDAALRGGAQRYLFFGGAALSGWLAGTAFAKAAGAESVERSEAYAERGALAALAACYVGAVLSKGFVGIREWGDGSTLRATVLAQHAMGRSEWLDAFAAFVGGSALVSQLFAWGTLAAQASAVFLPFGTRVRAVAASLLLVFHLNVWLLTPIVFPQAMVLLVAFGFPWPSWLALPQLVAMHDERLDVRRAFRPFSLASAGVAALCLFGWFGPFSAFSHAEHHDPSPADASRTHADGAPPRRESPPPPPDFARSAANALRVGRDVAGYRIVASGGTPEGAFVVTLAGFGKRFRVRVERAADASRNAPLTAHGRGFYFDYSKGDALPSSAELERVLAEVARSFSPAPPAGTGTNSSQP